MSGPYSSNGGGYPPPRSAYSPTTSGYREQPYRSNPPSLPPFPPPPFGSNPPQAPSQFRSPYDEYSPSTSAPLSGRSYDDNRRSFDQDVYDPYQPSAYDPGAPQIRTPASYQQPSQSGSGALTHRLPPRPGGERTELSLLTAPTVTSIGLNNFTVYTLPQSHLPITKYVTVNPGDAIDVHRALCQTGKAQSVWYAEANTRAGEGWGSAVEWVLETGMSGAKLRSCVPDTDSLGAELAAINKAVEGFRDQLYHSVRNQKPMSHEFVLFTSSAAALVSIDTSSHPESIQFCQTWREICTDYLQAHLTLVHLPKGSDVEGFSLAERIANVAAQNSYQKRRKERMLDEMYTRQGGGDPFPSGSTEGGAWQRGDADPSRRKSPFQRPKPLPQPEPIKLLPVMPPFPPPPRSLARTEEPPRAPPQVVQDSPRAADEPEDEGIKPRADALCVTNFPDDVSAKDLGILLAQFGDIDSVDMFSIPPVKSRFAFVAYADPARTAHAIEHLNGRPLNLDTPFALENAADLEIWKRFSGTLTMAASDPHQLIPASIAKIYPNLPGYAAGHGRESAESGQKRGRSHDEGPTITPPSPKKSRPDPSDHQAEPNSHPSSLPPRPAGLPPRPETAPDVTEGNGTSHASHKDTVAAPSAPLTAASTAPGLSELSAKSLAAGVAPSPPVPVVLSTKTLQAQIDLVTKVFIKHDRANWIVHTCLIATDLDQARRQLQEDLYATDAGVIETGELEAVLHSRGYTEPRIEAFVTKVLKVLDGIAAEDLPTEASSNDKTDDPALAATLEDVLQEYPPQTQEAMAAAGKVLEYLNLGLKEQEEKRVQMERRLGVLQGMEQIGEQVSKVVSLLLN